MRSFLHVIGVLGIGFWRNRRLRRPATHSAAEAATPAFALPEQKTRIVFSDFVPFEFVRSHPAAIPSPKRKYIVLKPFWILTVLELLGTSPLSGGQKGLWISYGALFIWVFVVPSFLVGQDRGDFYDAAVIVLFLPTLIASFIWPQLAAVLPLEYLHVVVQEIGSDESNDLASLYHVQDTPGFRSADPIFENQRIFLNYALAVAASYAVKRRLDYMLFSKVRRC